MAETVMSSRWPGLAKAGSSAVTITAAAFFSAGLMPGGKLRPKRDATPFMPCVEYSRLSSPVPASPTTIP
jgi:hypothetical protein